MLFCPLGSEHALASLSQRSNSGRPSGLVSTEPSCWSSFPILFVKKIQLFLLLIFNTFYVDVKISRVRGYWKHLLLFQRTWVPNPHSGSQPLITIVWRYLMPSSPFCRQYIHMMHIHTCWENTHIHKVYQRIYKWIFKNYYGFCHCVSILLYSQFCQYPLKFWHSCFLLYFVVLGLQAAYQKD